jgi:hypothetical protein
MANPLRKFNAKILLSFFCQKPYPFSSKGASMAELGLFPVVSYQNLPNPSFCQKLLEFSGDMVNFFGRTAYVVPHRQIQGKEGVVLSDSQDSLMKTVLKVILCSTLIFPTLCVLTYLALRPFYSFHVLEIEKELAHWRCCVNSCG